MSDETREKTRKVLILPTEAPGEAVPHTAPYILRGSTTHFTVYYDPILGATGAAAADHVLANCENDYSTIQRYFGGLTPPGLPFIVNIIGSGQGAYHYGCSDTKIFCDYLFATVDVSQNGASAALVAEVVEVFEAAQAKGWYCGGTNGEGLSRVLLAAIYPAVDPALTVADQWLDGGRPDYITTNLWTDTDSVSNGCGVLFLNWLHVELGISWDLIINAGAQSLSQTYTKLTQRNDAVQQFGALLQAHFPTGQPSGLFCNNPFPLGGMHVICTTEDGGLWIATRHGAPEFWHTAAGFETWDSFHSMMIETRNSGPFTVAACALVSGSVWNMHCCAVTVDRNLWHSIRQSNGVWLPFSNVKGLASDPGPITSVACASSDPRELQVCATTEDGNLWHTIRRADGTWFPFGDVKGQTGYLGSIGSVHCGSSAHGELQVLAMVPGGGLWHTIRRADGTWFPFGNVKGQTGDPGFVTSVACASSTSGELQVCATTEDGNLWHTIRRADGTWFPFGNVKGQAGNPGFFSGVACGSHAPGELQVYARTANGGLFYTIRHANGTWTPFNDVKSHAGDPGLISLPSCARASQW